MYRRLAVGAICILFTACGGDSSAGPDAEPGSVSFNVEAQGTGTQATTFLIRLADASGTKTDWVYGNVGYVWAMEDVAPGTYEVLYSDEVSPFCEPREVPPVTVRPGMTTSVSIVLDCVGQFFYVQDELVHWVDSAGRDLPLTGEEPSRVMSVSHDGRRFVTSEKWESDDLHSFIWSLDDLEHPIRVTGRVGQFSPDGTTLVGHLNNRLIFVDTGTGDILETVAGPERNMATGGTWAPDGNRVAYSDLKNVWIYDRTTRQHQKLGTWSGRSVHGLLWSPGDLIVFRVGAPSALIVVDTRTGEVVREFPGSGSGRAQWLDDTRFTALQGIDAWLFDVTTGSRTKLVPDVYDSPSSVTITPDMEQVLFTAPAPFAGVHVLDVTSGEARTLVSGRGIWVAVWLPFARGGLVEGG